MVEAAGREQDSNNVNAVVAAKEGVVEESLCWRLEVWEEFIMPLFFRLFVSLFYCGFKKNYTPPPIIIIPL